MKKIQTVFRRNQDNPKHVNIGDLAVTQEIYDAIESGDAVATRKFDGTCCMFDGEQWWARREVKPGQSEPAGFVAVGESGGKVQGWIPAEQSTFWKFMEEAGASLSQWDCPRGTYELIGPKINGNPEGVGSHFLILHGSVQFPFLGWRKQIAMARDEAREGVVWWLDGEPVAKLKVKDIHPSDWDTITRII